jgi:hypothetical protein
VAVNYAYRFSDIFQIFSVPPDASKPDAVLGSHPFVIEVSVSAGSNPFTNSNRGQLKIKKIKNLLSVLLQYNVGGNPASTQHRWVLDNPLENASVALKQVTYSCSDTNWRPDRLTDISNFSSPTMNKPREYYAKYGITGEEGLELPSNFDDQFKRYFSIDKKIQCRFERACYR